MIFVPYFIGERSRDHARLAGGELVAPVLPAAGAQQRLAVLYKELATRVAASEQARVQVGDCVAALGVAAGLQRRGVDFHLVWLDAHGDFNTWETRPGQGQRLASLRVFLSHTSDLGKHTEPASFVAAAVAAVLRSRRAVTDMAYFAARDSSPADVCADMVAQSDVYVGITGLRYRSSVRDRPDVSYTELEFEAAGEHGQPRLIFLIREDSVHLGCTRPRRPVSPSGGEDSGPASPPLVPAVRGGSEEEDDAGQRDGDILPAVVVQERAQAPPVDDPERHPEDEVVCAGLASARPSLRTATASMTVRRRCRPGRWRRGDPGWPGPSSPCCAA